MTYLKGEGKKRTFRTLLIVTAVSALLVSCIGPKTLYNVDLRYIPTEAAPKEMQERRNAGPIMVALFQDIREIDDHIVIGRVTAEGKKPLPVLPKYNKPPESIVKATEDFLIGRGYTVSAHHPVWDLQEKSIGDSWGTVLLGGTINKLFIECDRSGPVKKYKARVSVTMILADVKEKRILYKVTVESAPSRDHVRFTEIMMEQEINRALSEAIEKVFTGSALLAQIEEITH